MTIKQYIYFIKRIADNYIIINKLFKIELFGLVYYSYRKKVLLIYFYVQHKKGIILFVYQNT